MTTRDAVESRYGLTRLLAAVFRVIAVLGVATAVIVALEANASLTYSTPHTWFLLASIVVALFLLAAAEGMQIMLDMEEHQRAIRQHVAAIARSRQEVAE